MNTDGSESERRVTRSYSAEERERLIKEFEASGQTKKAFCDEHGINVGTFYGWFQRASGKQRGERARSWRPKPAFAELMLSGRGEAPVEIVLPNGTRVCIRHAGPGTELAGLVRGICGYRRELHEC